MSSSTPDPWAWLGLLKWSLSYSDGTSNNTTLTPMSAEDKAFLEAVMREGIIDENARMKTILTEITDILTKWKDNTGDSSSSTTKEEEQEQVDTMLEELRDIVEQIDYARAFTAMKGLDFLLGAVVVQQQIIPASTRGRMLRVLATLSHNNPPVQDALLQAGAIAILTQVYNGDDDCEEDSSSSSLQGNCIQALSAMVRSHAMAEEVFCHVETSLALLQSGLSNTNGNVRKRTLFFLSALVTSDTATRQRIQALASCIAWAIENYIVSTSSATSCAYADDDFDAREIRETALSMVQRILEQAKCVNPILQYKNSIAATAVPRVAALRRVQQQDVAAAEFSEDAAGDVELESWEQILVLLARAAPDNDDDATDAASPTPLLLEANEAGLEQ